jgi:hypothetical protein
LAWGLFALAATFVAFLVLLILQNRPGARPPVSETSTESVVAAEVASRYAVPNEAPVVMRLSDVDALARVHPEFYAGLLDGDWLVRYPGVLIVYRREEGRIVKIETVDE